MFSRGNIIAYLCLAAGVGFAVNAAEEANSRTHKLAVESAKTRVKTVESRCDLTHKIIGVLSQRSPADFLGFQKSYETCLEQLGEVEEIAKKASR